MRRTPPRLHPTEVSPLLEADIRREDVGSCEDEERVVASCCQKARDRRHRKAGLCLGDGKSTAAGPEQLRPLMLLQIDVTLDETEPMSGLEKRSLINEIQQRIIEVIDFAITY